MDNFVFRFPLRLALLFLTVSLSITLCGAQSTRPAPAPANPPAGQSAAETAYKAKLTPPAGKKRGLTNAMRMAAAIRNADRKAHAPARGSSVSGQTGGIQ